MGKKSSFSEFRKESAIVHNVKDNQRFILAALYKNQPLSKDELVEKLVILASQFGSPSRTIQRDRPGTVR